MGPGPFSRRHEGRSPEGWYALTRHFFRAHFDLGFLSEAGADSFTRIVIVSLALPWAFGRWLAEMYLQKYPTLTGESAYERALLADETSIVAMPMVMLALVTVLISRSLFPSESDYRVLMALPVTRRAIFGAKVAALVLFLGLFIAAVNLSIGPQVLLVTHGPWATHSLLARLAAHGVASVAASIFAVASVAAVVAVISLCVPRAHAERVVGVLQTGLLCLLVLALTMVFQLSTYDALFASEPWRLYLVPSAWFVGIGRVLLGETGPPFLGLAEVGLLALIVAGGCVAGGYLLFYRHFDRVLFPPQPRDSRWFRLRPWRAAGRRRGEPSRAAVGQFTSLTLRRSALHRGVFAGVAACGVGLMLIVLIRGGLGDWLRLGGEPTFGLTYALTYVPFVLMFATIMGLRAALLLPIEPRANWIFRMTELDATRPRQLTAVTRTFRWMGLGFPLLAVLPLHARWLGVESLVSLTVAALCGAALIELVLMEWRRIPFTCSYMPGKRFVVLTFLIAVSIFTAFANLGAALLGMSLADPRLAVAVVVLLVGGVGALRWHRLKTWGKLSLEFDDELPDALQPLRLTVD